VTDDELLAQVHAAFTALDPVPGALPQAGRAALGWRTPGAVLAELCADQDASTAGIRGGARLLTFSCPEARVEFEVLDAEIAGQVERAGPRPAEVLVRHPAGGLATTTDRHGRFTVSPVPSGPVSLVFRWPDATSVVTSWVRL
jgi:hypothetical protein